MSRQTRDAIDQLATYVEQRDHTITNALGNQARRMAEAADLAASQDQPGYAKVFRQEADSVSQTLETLQDLLTALAESRQEDFANQG